MTINIHSTYKLGPITLRNRAVMSPMTRSRAIGNVPNALMATYFGQRAGDAGLIITEGTSPSPNGLGYPRIPGLFNAEHVAGWKGVTSAVHAKGGRIFVQLMHTGRVANTGNLPAGARVLAPSAIVIDQQIWVDPDGNQPVTPAHEMSAADIEHAIGEHVHAGKLAIEAGFDGVELHGANGYLLEQFLNSTSNHRADDWGGSVEKRCKFGFEIAQRLAAAIGGERVGIRMSPYGVNGGIAPDPDVETSYPRFAGMMKRAGLAYVHVADHSAMGAPAVSASVKANIRKEFGGTIILAGGYDLAHANADLAEGKGELVAFGRNYLANPTYLARASKGEALNAPDFTTLYSPGEKGYTDYL